MKDFYELETISMGTIITQKIYGENSQKAALKVEEEIKKLESLMSFFLETSEISKINRNAGLNAVEVSADVLYVLNRAKYFSEVSSGAFDITIGPVAKLWGIFTDKAKIPSQEEITSSLKFTGHRDITIDNSLGSVKLEKVGESIDLGAIAKGYAADKAIEIYKQYNIDSAFVNLGGNVMVLGTKPDGSPWKIGIQNPLLRRDLCLGAVHAVNKTIVTSGDYVRYLQKNNKKYHHILDPRTGYPSDSGLISTTIVSEKSIGADAISTAIFVLGLEDGVKLVNSLKDMEAIFITEDKEIHVTEGLKKDFHFFDEVEGFIYKI
ncbi:FAD:protein FMN transferase [Clostridium cellulovorans]|uniref:FAD:protein FMN transferase n=1 Tax=Clostridium cellulovorans (strain ATCC 35296 / DSM 3052 / OCM 3 / 743B) TaxID=573061 RepID=D9SRV6_CLOC7|nr:FAD:protein FMN transferase [Clostridium cellulovorans]ADL50473.1 ApbE family lipoprotein [Clostridium cellulovorans 743B]